MNDHITKPIDPVKLFHTLAKWDRPQGHGAKPAEGFPGSTGSAGQRAGVFSEQILAGWNCPSSTLAEGLQRLMGNGAAYRKLLVNFRPQSFRPGKNRRTSAPHWDASDFAQAQRTGCTPSKGWPAPGGQRLRQQSVALGKNWSRPPTPGSPSVGR